MIGESHDGASVVGAAWNTAVVDACSSNGRYSGTVNEEGERATSDAQEACLLLS
jgi:hypothetical protein